MPVRPTIEFVETANALSGGTLVVLRAGTAALPDLPAGLTERLDHAARAAKFEGAAGKSLDLWAPGAIDGVDGTLDRVVMLGIGAD